MAVRVGKFEDKSCEASGSGSWPRYFSWPSTIVDDKVMVTEVRCCMSCVVGKKASEERVKLN